MIPTDFGRRVALARCSCGEAGCGVIAPVIVGSVDGRTISWIDFRDFVGVFDGPLATWTTDWEGVPWPIPDLHFDSDAYLREIHRVRRQLR